MKKAVVVFILVLLIFSFIVTAAPLMELTPKEPYADENLLCKYLEFSQGDVLFFRWFLNDQLVKSELTDKQSMIFNLETNNLDRITCEISKRDVQGDNRLVLVDEKSVAVGRFHCNDGKDNDGDNLIDFSDPGCDTRSDNSEINVDLSVFCNQHPDNYLCLGLGISDIASLCQESQNNHFCQIEYIRSLFQGCQENQADYCKGVQDVTFRCNENEDPICQLFVFAAIGCQEENVCYEVTKNDKVVLCGIEEYDFCVLGADVDINPGFIGEPCLEGICNEGVCLNNMCVEHEIAVNPGFLGEECFEGDCFEGLCVNNLCVEENEIYCSSDRFDLCTRSVCKRYGFYWFENECGIECPKGYEDNDKDRVCVKNKVLVCPSGFVKVNKECVLEEVPKVEPQKFCGNGICELDEPVTCIRDCETVKESSDENLAVFGVVIFALTLMGIIGWSVLKKIKK